MTVAKVDIKIGALSFAGEGDKEWLAKQLDKLIQHAPGLLNVAPVENQNSGGGVEKGAALSGKVGTLAAFLIAKKAKDSQPVKFLATAAWLHAKGNKRLLTKQISKALDENNQGRLSNPADCLIKNTTKGYCERSGKEFYVTDEGLKSLG